MNPVLPVRHFALILLGAVLLLIAASILTAVGTARALTPPVARLRGSGTSAGLTKIRSRFASLIASIKRGCTTSVHKVLKMRGRKISTALNVIARSVARRFSLKLRTLVHAVERILHVKLTRAQESLVSFMVLRDYVSKVYQHMLVARMISKGRMHVVSLPVATFRYGNVVIYRVDTAVRVIGDGPANPYPINTWIQLAVDVYGGSGHTGIWPYDVNGNNTLYKVVVAYNSTTAIYTLYFYDEDCPNPVLDKIYDALRKLIYGRTIDIESFYVKNGEIVFADIWSGSHPYAYPIGQHGYCARPYKPGVAVYVSNVWNHAMDTVNTNPGMQTIVWRT